MGNGIKFFNLKDNYGGGGTIFEAGTYRVEKSQFTLYTYNDKVMGKDDKGVCCLMWKVQPVDPKTHKDSEGPAVVQYWGCGDDMEPANKGKEIAFRDDATHDVIWKGSDFYKFMEALQKAEFDVDKYEDENDVTMFEGMVFEMGLMKDPFDKSEQSGGKGLDDDKGKDKKKSGPRMIVVVTGVPKAKGATAKSKSKEEPEEKAPAKTKDKGGSKKGLEPESDSAADLVDWYLQTEVFKEDNESGIETIVARSGIMRVIGKAYDGDKARECINYWNKKGVLDSLCTTYGWEVDGGIIKKS